MNQGRIVLTFAIGVIVGAAASAGAFAHADEKPVDQSPRAMMSNQDDAAPLGDVPAYQPSDRKPDERDFRWDRLAADSGALGKDPVVGPRSGKAYFDFRDGLPHPYYIAPGS